MMAEKARLSDDADSLRRILAVATPAEAKALGRQVKGFNAAQWDAVAFARVVRGNLAKFGQNAPLRDSCFRPPTMYWSRPARWTASGASALPPTIPAQPIRRNGKVKTALASR